MGNWDDTCPECGGKCELERVTPDDKWEVKCRKCEYFTQSETRARTLNYHEQMLDEKRHLDLVEARRFPIPDLAEQAQDPELDDKTAFELLDLDFSAAMCDNFREGIKNGRTANGWRSMAWTKQMEGLYTAKILRHLKAFYAETDHDARLQHMAAIACDANIVWHHTKESHIGK